MTNPYRSEPLGKRIRDLRQERRLTMQGLADLAGLSRGGLGSIERGLTAPSIDTVRRLAKAMDISLVSILDAAPTASLGAVGQPEEAIELVRRGERMALRFPTQPFFWEVLTPLHGELGILMAEVVPTDRTPELVQHDGIESYLVLAGRLKIRIGSREFELDEGDCITFPAAISHGTRNPGPDISRVINVTTPSDFGSRQSITVSREQTSREVGRWPDPPSGRVGHLEEPSAKGAVAEPSVQTLAPMNVHDEMSPEAEGPVDGKRKRRIGRHGRHSERASR
jgi:transcriptional regulator with XRE-family HTH domain